MTGLALARRRTHAPDGLVTFSAGRDVGALARLLRLAFGAELDRRDERWLSDLETVSRFGPLLSLLGAIPPMEAGLGGYVWYADGRLVGNVSLMPRGGDAWMVANVVTHPDWRRRGIARDLMVAAMDSARARGGRTVELQVRDDNDAAQALYAGLRFHCAYAITTMRFMHSDRLVPLAGASADVTVAPWRARDNGDAWRVLEAAGIRRTDDLSGPVGQWLTQHGPWRGVVDLLQGQRRLGLVGRDGTAARAVLSAVVQVLDGPHRLEIACDPGWRGRAEAALLGDALAQLRGARDDQLDAQFRSDELPSRALLESVGFQHVKTLDRLVASLTDSC